MIQTLITTPTTCIFSVSDFEEVKNKVLNWTKQFSTFCFLDNHQYQIEPHSLECLLAAGVKRSIKANAGSALQQLDEFIEQRDCWLFGHLGYDLKNEIEHTESRHPDRLGFPDLFFFEPEIVIRLSQNEMIIEADDPVFVFNAIRETIPSADLTVKQELSIRNRYSREEYITIINTLKKHILRGDCYEINFCQEFYSTGLGINPLTVYQKLSRISPNPFSAFYHVDDQWLMCASPERFLRGEGKKILSQPIKGTSHRVNDDVELDELSGRSLKNSAKERSENVMVVDLVRNDLAKICEEGTVKVEELYGIYSFPQVHQMISTVSGSLKADISFSGIIRATFPMGSMTGAPKKKVMELIELYENSRRGIFSGALGYIGPGNRQAGKANFDFNVVIRSIMYNAATHYLSIQAGSGITFYSDPEKEWEECMLKVEAMKKAVTD